MPYVKRTVVAGGIIETKKFMNGRVHSKGNRAKNSGETGEAQAKCNERKTEEKLRWLLNANFSENDLHVVLHYGDKPQEFGQIEKDAQKFLSMLKKELGKTGTVLKYVLVIETKRMSNPHIHAVLNDVDPKIIKNAWKKTVGKSYVSITMLDDRGNHAELAAYLTKESRSTAKKWKEAFKNKKRFWSSRNLERPEPSYEVVPAKSWRTEPKARAGYALYKFKDGETVRGGFHEISGYPWCEYFEIPTARPIRRKGRKAC